MDEMTTSLPSELVAFFRSYGVQLPSLTDRLCATVLADRAPDEDILGCARRLVSRWMHEVVGPVSPAVPGWERLAFLLSGAASSAPELLLSGEVSPQWRARLQAAVPHPTPPLVPGQMPDASLEPIPALVAVRSFVLPQGPKAEEGQEPTL